VRVCLHHQEGVQPLESDRVDVEQVSGEQSVGLSLEECGPLATRGMTSRSGAQASGAQDAEDGRGADPVPEAAQFAVHSSEAPAWVLGAETHDQLAQFLWNGGSPRGRRLRPFLLDKPLVPGKECAWGDDPVAAQHTGEQPGEGGEQGAVRPGRPGRGDLAAQHRHLVPQDQYFSVLGRRRAQVEHSHEHRD
jgi:hypothetical protein